MPGPGVILNDVISFTLSSFTYLHAVIIAQRDGGGTRRTDVELEDFPDMSTYDYELECLLRKRSANLLP